MNKIQTLSRFSYNSQHFFVIKVGSRSPSLRFSATEADINLCINLGSLMANFAFGPLNEKNPEFF